MRLDVVDRGTNGAPSEDLTLVAVQEAWFQKTRALKRAIEPVLLKPPYATPRLVSPKLLEAE